MSDTNTNYLANLLGEVNPSHIGKDDLFRRYRIDSTTRICLRGNVDTSVKTSCYYVGRVGGPGTGLSRPSDATIALNTAIRVSDYYASDFAGSAKKYANFSGDFSTMDLAGMVERLSAGIAHYSVHGKLTASQLRGGGHVSIISINATTAPVAASTNHVWIPRSADSVTAPNCFAALLNAASGEGATVVTDLLQVDNSNAPVVPEVENDVLAEGCYHALRLLGGNYSAAGGDDIFAYAVTRGIHKVVNVAAHTSEGGWFRKALRAGRFAVPFGGINVRFWDYTGLPRAMSSGAKTFSALTDTIALATAGAVAACDPLVQLNGVRLPTVLSANAGFASPGVDSAPVSGSAARLATSLANESGEFCRLYSRACTIIMGMKANTGLAANHLLTCIRLANLHEDRHLQLNTIAPYFWVEPTGICNLPATEFPAVAEGYAQLATVQSPGTIPLLPKAYDVTAAGPRVRASFAWASARKVGLLVHLNHHPDNGLGCVRLRAADADAWALVGHAGKSVQERLVGGTTVDSFLWTRGDSLFIAPAEAVYTQKWVTAELLTHHWDDDSGNTTLNHVPSASELLNGQVTIETTRLVPWKVGTLKGDPRDVSRARSRAVQALARARAIAGADFDDGFVAVSLSAPSGPGTAEPAPAGPSSAGGPEPKQRQSPDSGPADEPGLAKEGDGMTAQHKVQEAQEGGTHAPDPDVVPSGSTQQFTEARGVPIARETEARLLGPSKAYPGVTWTSVKPAIPEPSGANPPESQ